MDTYFIPKLFLGPFETTLRSKVQTQQQWHYPVWILSPLILFPIRYSQYLLTRGHIHFKKAIKNYIHFRSTAVFSKLLTEFSENYLLKVA